MASMFANAHSFNQLRAWWPLDEKANMKSIFEKSELSYENYCALVSLQVWKDKVETLGQTYECKSGNR